MNNDTDFVDNFSSCEFIALLPEKNCLSFFLLKLKHIPSTFDHLFCLEGVVLVMSVMHVILLLITTQLVLFLKKESRDPEVN
jgi:hypothetical protein